MPKKSVHLHSQQPPKSSGQNRQRLTPNRVASAQRPASVAQTNGTAPEYIQDMVIPVSYDLLQITWRGLPGTLFRHVQYSHCTGSQLLLFGCWYEENNSTLSTIMYSSSSHCYF
jgi:hypothetical protein